MKKTLTIFVQTALLFIPGLAFADATGPEISPVSPLSAFYDVAQTYTVTADDADGVAGCELLVSSIYRTPMTYDSVGDRWTVSYTFTTRRSANSIRAVCTDGAGNEVNGPSRIITVAEVPTEETDGSASGTGTPPLEVDVTTWSSDAVVLLSPVLIKTRCPGGEDVNHPCRTVYFLDTLGVRHAFPNEATYFTWYSDWRNIYVVSDDAMTSYPIGEPVAAALYGSDWATWVDDVPEVFHGNYTIGEDVNAPADFNKDIERASVVSINDNLNFVSP
ncbi:MAG: hypothetical protein UY95_C0018G0003 [Parcubacteria group bacterium GW2011_GWA2_56_7]|nr:MAG: hypothetical protein UY95_C0018G0003 [Parcubacteria group bacterium GW2011_GWA2_56_7]